MVLEEQGIKNNFKSKYGLYAININQVPGFVRLCVWGVIRW